MNTTAASTSAKSRSCLISSIVLASSACSTQASSMMSAFKDFSVISWIGSTDASLDLDSLGACIVTGSTIFLIASNSDRGVAIAS